LQKDIFQDILIEGWRSYAKFNSNASFGTWIYRIALNVIFMHYRKYNNRPKNISLNEDINIVEEKVQLSPHAELLRKIISTLAAVDKSIITAHLDSYNNHEIAEILGISVSNVGVKLHRIKNLIKSKIEEGNYGH